MRAQKILRDTNVRKLVDKDDAIKSCIMITSMLLVFLLGYFMTWSIFQKPMTEGQFELCEKVARDAYLHKDDESYNVLDFVSVEVEKRTVYVRMKDFTYRDKVIATVDENDELIIMRYIETEEARCKSLLIGLLFAIIICPAMELSGILEEEIFR